MANADGSGGLTRLTYNDTFDSNPSWATVPVIWSAEPTVPSEPAAASR